MSREWYLVIAILVIVALAAIVVFSYLAYRKIPAPSGYQDVHPNADKCGDCAELGCPFYERFHKKEEE